MRLIRRKSYLYQGKDIIRKGGTELHKVSVGTSQPWASLPVGTPPRQKSNRVESSTKSGKLLKIASRVLDFRVTLNLILLVILACFRVEYFE